MDVSALSMDSPKFSIRYGRDLILTDIFLFLSLASAAQASFVSSHENEVLRVICHFKSYPCLFEGIPVFFNSHCFVYIVATTWEHLGANKRTKTLLKIVMNSKVTNCCNYLTIEADSHNPES
ncbi:hypothetical protein CHS0354_012427 [Potamilus streckersoni]|uniref:Uncharacterized protein n=1 Tax=Potamilus streckersoni TaxID=2493646 RepID=A0AAE0SFA3_9BIVA|nr:hypothetical protein CHS0354_012427 [Potamilus streckersoni]